jgi:putative MFS transporter
MTAIHLGTTVALTLAALSWGMVNFGFLLWLPSALVDEGFSVEVASGIIKNSSLVALPMVVICAWLYSQWSTKWTLTTMLAIIALGLVAALFRGTGLPGLSSPVTYTTLLIIGSTGAISVLLPYTAECYPLRVRGRASGWIAGCSKLGGLAAQAVSLFLGVPPLGHAAVAILLPIAASLGLMERFGIETKGRDLRELESRSPKMPI